MAEMEEDFGSVNENGKKIHVEESQEHDAWEPSQPAADGEEVNSNESPTDEPPNLDSLSAQATKEKSVPQGQTENSAVTDIPVDEEEHIETDVPAMTNDPGKTDQNEGSDVPSLPGSQTESDAQLEVTGEQQTTTGARIEDDRTLPVGDTQASETRAKATESDLESPADTGVSATMASKSADSSDSSDQDEEEEDDQQQEDENDYSALSLENLVGEMQRLLRTESISTISKKVNLIRQEFDQKFQDLLEEKKDEFVQNGGNEIDFRFQSVAKRQFNELMAEYRDKRDQHYKQIENELKKNHEARLGIIEELKSLINVEEDLHHTYKSFKEIQEKWRNAGPVSRMVYNDLMQTYHHHTEIFYDFLHLNRELRDLDFQHNLEAKEKIVARAEELVKDPDLNKALFELQALHRIWKEDIGPVAKEKREEIWNRFSEATKALHQRRQEYFKELEGEQKINLDRKLQLIERIHAIASDIRHEHKELQQQIRDMESIREEFLSIGRVPKAQRDATWSAFKNAMREFNKKKNSLYKELKNTQLDNLRRKKELIERAVALKDSDDHEVVTPEMKRIQNEWKKIGHVPRKYSDKIWKEFKTACNEYFDRINSAKKKEHQEENENFTQKKALLEKFEALAPSGDKDKDLKVVKALIADWKKVGRVPLNKKDINDKFNKKVDQYFSQLGIDQHQSEILRYGNKIEELSSTNDLNSVLQERSFIRRKIEEGRQEIRQLENNLEFFSSSSGKANPLLVEVEKNIDRQRRSLETWEAKLKNVNILMHRLKKEKEAEASGESSEEGAE